VQTTSTGAYWNYSIEEFAPGSSTPMRTIGGSLSQGVNNGLINPQAIVVAP
jgi:hypothetical protein